MTLETAPMWRVKFVEGNGHGGGSGGDWAYYEANQYDRMEQDLFEALLNGDCGDGNSMKRNRNRLSTILRRRRKPELDDDTFKWRRHRVIEVAYLDGAEWVPVKVSWTPPQVVIEAVQ